MDLENFHGEVQISISSFNREQQHLFIDIFVLF